MPNFAETSHTHEPGLDPQILANQGETLYETLLVPDVAAVQDLKEMLAPKDQLTDLEFSILRLALRSGSITPESVVQNVRELAGLPAEELDKFLNVSDPNNLFYFVLNRISDCFEKTGRVVPWREEEDGSWALGLDPIVIRRKIAVKDPQTNTDVPSNEPVRSVTEAEIERGREARQAAVDDAVFRYVLSRTAQGGVSSDNFREELVVHTKGSPIQVLRAYRKLNQEGKIRIFTDGDQSYVRVTDQELATEDIVNQPATVESSVSASDSTLTIKATQDQDPRADYLLSEAELDIARFAVGLFAHPGWKPGQRISIEDMQAQLRAKGKDVDVRLVRGARRKGADAGVFKSNSGNKKAGIQPASDHVLRRAQDPKRRERLLQMLADYPKNN